MFWGTVSCRQKRALADISKDDVEYSEGVFLGISGLPAKLLVGTPQGVFRSRGVRALSDQSAKWST